MGCNSSKKLSDSTSAGLGKINPVYHVSGFENSNDYLSEKNINSYKRNTENFLYKPEIRKNKKYHNKIISKYTVLQEIGKGTFSRVVRAESKLTKEPFALKIMEDKKGREAFDAEISVLRRVKCKYILNLKEVLHYNEKICLVLTLATGGNLMEKVIQRGRFGEIEAGRTMKMVLEGVKYLHNLGITHRDLKPDNLLYYKPGYNSRIMISDFALSHCRK